MVTYLRVLWERIRAFAKAPSLDRDFEQELESHLSLLVEDNLRRGLTLEEARREARVRLGGLAQLSEAHRERRGLPALAALSQDLRYAVRTLKHDAGFTIFAVLIVGLGIGASATIFSVLNAVLLRPLPFRDPGQLVWIGNTDTAGEGLSGETVPTGHFTDLRDRNRSFSDIAALVAFYSAGDSMLSGDGEPERLSGVTVSENFFSVLGIEPVAGRTFRPEECQGTPGGPKAVLLSHSLWKRRFASDPRIVGRVLTVNDAPVTIVGVLPASFDFGAVFSPGSRIDFYFPLALTQEFNRRGNTVSMLGRLKPSVTIQQAKAEMSVLGPQIQRKDPDRNFQPALSLLDEHVSGRLRPALFVLACAVGVLMLIVCANISNLLMARSAARQKEMAIRAALGAGRGRLIRQMLTESIVLSGCGALLGIALAGAATRVLRSLDALSIPLLGTVQLDFGALGFTLLLAIATGLLFGILPALQAPADAVHDSLKDAARGASQGRRHSWVRSGLVVSETALACILLVGAGLLIRSFLRLLDVNLGFQPERAATLRIDPGSRYSTAPKRSVYIHETLRLVKSIPGIESAGLTDVLPFGGDRTWGVGAKDRLSSYSKEYPPPMAFVRIVSEGYFKAMGIPLLKGRDFDEHDAESGKKVIILNETLARELWPGQDPIGRTVIEPDQEVIGVVADVRHLALDQTSGPEMYLPIRQTMDYSSIGLVVRTTLPPGSLASAVRAKLRMIDPNLPANEFVTLRQIVDKTVSPRRFVVILLACFSGSALILASLGIYAVISYLVNQRTQELGIRMALGASARDLQAQVLLRTVGLAGLGILVGGIAALLFSRVLNSLLFGVTATDPATFLWTIAILIAVAALAGYLPARRASQIDPMAALRSN